MLTPCCRKPYLILAVDQSFCVSIDLKKKDAQKKKKYLSNLGKRCIFGVFSERLHLCPRTFGGSA